MSEFIRYVKSFYGPGGLYDMNATDDHIIDATFKYIQSGADFCGDSFDRENVRDIMMDEMGLVPI